MFLHTTSHKEVKCVLSKQNVFHTQKMRQAVASPAWFLPFLRSVLQGVQDALTQECESCSAISHPFQQFELVDLSFNQSVVLGKGQTRDNGCFVPLDPLDKAL